MPMVLENIVLSEEPIAILVKIDKSLKRSGEHHAKLRVVSDDPRGDMIINLHINLRSCCPMWITTLCRPGPLLTVSTDRYEKGCCRKRYEAHPLLAETPFGTPIKKVLSVSNKGKT